jgi:hypothetical protein
MILPSHSQRRPFQSVSKENACFCATQKTIKINSTIFLSEVNTVTKHAGCNVDTLCTYRNQYHENILLGGGGAGGGPLKHF